MDRFYKFLIADANIETPSSMTLVNLFINKERIKISGIFVKDYYRVFVRKNSQTNLLKYNCILFNN